MGKTENEKRGENKKIGMEKGRKEKKGEGCKGKEGINTRIKGRKKRRKN